MVPLLEASWTPCGWRGPGGPPTRNAQQQVPRPVLSAIFISFNEFLRTIWDRQYPRPRIHNIRLFVVGRIARKLGDTMSYATDRPDTKSISPRASTTGSKEVRGKRIKQQNRFHPSPPTLSSAKKKTEPVNENSSNMQEVKRKPSNMNITNPVKPSKASKGRA